MSVKKEEPDCVLLSFETTTILPGCGSVLFLINCMDPKAVTAFSRSSLTSMLARLTAIIKDIVKSRKKRRAEEEENDG